MERLTMLRHKPPKFLLAQGFLLVKGTVRHPSDMVMNRSGGGKQPGAGKAALKRRFPITVGHAGRRTGDTPLSGQVISSIRYGNSVLSHFSKMLFISMILRIPSSSETRDSNPNNLLALSPEQ